MSMMKPTPVVLDVVTNMLGRAPTQQELINLAPFAVMVQAFMATSTENDRFALTCQQWRTTVLYGLVDTNGQKIEFTIQRGGTPPSVAEAIETGASWVQRAADGGEDQVIAP
jgi:hypothetical protein